MIKIKDIVKVKLIYNDGQEKIFDLEKEKKKITIQIVDEDRHIDIYEGESKEFKFKTGEITKTETQCLFCNNKIKLEYYDTSDIEVICPKCGAFIYVSTMKTGDDLIEIFDYLTPPDIHKLHNEKKIKVAPFQYATISNSNQEIAINYIIFCFPFTDEILKQHLTSEEVYELNKIWQGQKESDITKKIQEKVQEKIEIIDNEDFWYALWESIFKKQLPTDIFYI